MLKRAFLAALLLGVAPIAAQAKCYQDASGGGQTCETTAPRATPVVGTTAAIATGGTAVTLVTGPASGGYIVNPQNAAAQGISVSENAYVDPAATPGSTDSAANGTTAILQPGQVFRVPPLATGALIKGNAATSGHKLTVVTW